MEEKEGGRERGDVKGREEKGREQEGKEGKGKATIFQGCKKEEEIEGWRERNKETLLELSQGSCSGYREAQP